MNTIYRLIGRTVLIRDYRGDGISRLIRVTSIRNTHDDRVTWKSRDRRVMVRGCYLITGNDLDRNVIRSYYVDHADLKEVGVMGRLHHRLSVWLGYRASY